MRTQINVTSGKWHAEILSALIEAFDIKNKDMGYTITLENETDQPVRVYGLGKDLGSDDKITLLVGEDRHRVGLKLNDKIYFNK